MIRLVMANVETQNNVSYWLCWLSIERDGEKWLVHAHAPIETPREDLVAFFEPQEDDLWLVAQAEGYQDDVFKRVSTEQLLRAFALVVLDEVNALRTKANMPQRTAQQLISAIEVKLNG